MEKPATGSRDIWELFQPDADEHCCWLEEQDYSCSVENKSHSQLLSSPLSSVSIHPLNASSSKRASASEANASGVKRPAAVNPPAEYGPLMDGTRLRITDIAGNTRTFSRRKPEPYVECAGSVDPAIHQAVLSAISSPISAKKDAVRETCGGGVPWIHKYAPRKFTELISADHANKEALQWLLAWKSRDTLPPQRLLLAHGRPGSGKTTLLRIASESIGYAPFIINAASGEDTTTAMAEKIVTATSTDTIVIAKDGRRGMKERLLIIEELECAPPDINACICATILKLIDAGGDGEKNRIYRPIVIICSDPWSPMLKSLRNSALVIHVQISGQRLTERIKEIIVQENIRCSYEEMSLCGKLAEASQGDVREALYALQFSSTEANPVSKAISHLSNIVCAPSSSMYFKVMEEIFLTRHRLSKSEKAQHPTFAEKDLILHLFSKRLELLGGDLERIFDGCFEAYLKCASLGSAVDMLELVALKDLMDAFRNARPNASLLDSILHFIVLKFHVEFGGGVSLRLNPSSKGAIIAYPKESYESRIMLDAKRAAVRTWLYSKTHKDPTLLFSFLAAQQSHVCYDVLPFLMRAARPSSAIMNSHNPSFRSEAEIKFVERLYSYRLFLEYSAPNLVLAPLNSVISTDVHPSIVSIISRINKQIEEHGIKMRVRMDKTVDGASAYAWPALPVAAVARDTNKEPGAGTKRDFFGRVVSAPGLSQPPVCSQERFWISFKYQEKSAHAVRKDITVSRLLYANKPQS